MKKLLPLLSILILFIFGFTAVITKTPVLVDIAWIALAAFSTYMAISSVIYSVKCHKSKRWPKSLYTIENERISDRIVEKRKYYYVSGNIVYEVNGDKYTKDLRDDYNELTFKNHDDAINHINALKNKKYKTIYYDPNEPETSILEPGINIRSILAIIVAIGLFYVATASYLGVINWV